MPKLLLADDSPTTQKVVQLTFADEGIEVVVADDGDTALELFAHHHPDIVLADINIPGLNGYEVCEAIRKRQDNGSTPVILLAGSFEPFDVEQAHRVGANDYLTKPFASIRRLVATVTALLDTVVRHDAAAEETIEPNSVPPNADELKPEVATTAPHSPEHEPGPVLPPEPDMYATDDIQSLISQSFVETVEMPHTVAERVMNEIATENGEHQSDEPATSHDDLAFDDELIETTFASEPEGSNKQTDVSGEETHNGEHDDWAAPATEFNQEPEIGSSNGYAETPSPELHVEPLSQEFAPPETEFGTSNDTQQTNEIDQGDTYILSLAFQIDQSNDETYFEPAVEISEHPSEAPDQPAEVLSEAAGQPIEQTSEPTGQHVDEQTGFQIVSFEESKQESEMVESTAASETSDPQLVPDEPTELAQGESGTVAEHSPPATPWDSVAEPQPPRFQMDESNLLELPLSFGNRIAEPAHENESNVSKAASELAPAIVDEIARVTASQISEELVREIAQRIVPRVVEEVMARHRSENEEQ